MLWGKKTKVLTNHFKTKARYNNNYNNNNNNFVPRGGPKSSIPTIRRSHTQGREKRRPSTQMLWEKKKRKYWRTILRLKQGITTTTTTTTTTITTLLCRAGVRKARFQQYDDHTLRGGRKGDPQHKCCGKETKILTNNFKTKARYNNNYNNNNNNFVPRGGPKSSIPTIRRSHTQGREKRRPST